MCFKGLRWEDNDEITWCRVFGGAESFSKLNCATTYIFKNCKEGDAIDMEN